MNDRYVLESGPDWSGSPLGGKADSLVRMAQSGFRVPRFIVFRADPEGAVIDDLLGAAVASLLSSDPDQDRYAVRSSADVEDGESASYAGMFDSVLGVRAEDLNSAITGVARSASADRVGEYQSALDLDTSSRPTMNVVVQVMIAATSAGVAFSRHATGSDDVVVEAVLGLGEYLVAGTVEPDSYTCRREPPGVLAKLPGYQSKKLALVDGMTKELPVPGVDRRALKLTTDETLQLANLAVRAEQTFRWHAADIEWAIDHSGVWLLQARPYAALSI